MKLHSHLEAPAVLLVCLGNICRSPLAEAALRAEARAHGLDWHIDSAGTGDWHVGRPPDGRAIAEAARQGLGIGHLRARQVGAADFDRFTHILALDRQNLADVQAMAPPHSTARNSLLLDWLPGHEGRDVPDPYYGADADFAHVWHLVSEAAAAFTAAQLQPRSG